MKYFLSLVCVLTLCIGAVRAEEKEKKQSAAEVLEKKIGVMGVERGLTDFRWVMKQPSSRLKYDVKESEFNLLGYQLRYRGEIRGSLEVFKFNTERFPDSSNAWDSLGEGYIYSGNKKEAVRSYEKSLELDPKNMNASWKLKRIDREIFDAAHETTTALIFKPGDNTGFIGPYLAQRLPGDKPQVFAPGIVSTLGGHEFSCSFTPDGRSFYFNRGMNIYVSHWKKKGWTAPEPAAFASRNLDHEPHITADGETMYFGSGRPREGVKPEETYGIWVMNRRGRRWGKPRYFGPGMYVSTTASGEIYLTDVTGGYRNAGLAKVLTTDGNYQKMERLTGKNFETHQNAHPCIAWDGSYIIFDSERPVPDGGRGGSNFFLSFRLPDGSWGEPVYLDNISTPGTNMTASLSPDGKYLFYYASHDIYWVSTSFIDELRKRQEKNRKSSRFAPEAAVAYAPAGI